jgi:Putative zinc-finger
MPDHFTADLSSYLDGELDAVRQGRLESHLAQCAECSRMLADLRAIVTEAPHYQGHPPERDLWPAIEAGLSEPRVLELRQAGKPVRRLGWRELIAASFVMAAIGGSATWFALRISRGPSAAPATAISAAGPAVLSSAPSAPKTVAYAEAQYDAAVRDLERELEAGRGRLDSTTVRTVERSLRTIDAAIVEARAAIQRDPANAYLSRQIAANMRRKLNLLRTVTNAIAART